VDRLVWGILQATTCGKRGTAEDSLASPTFPGTLHKLNLPVSSHQDAGVVRLAYSHEVVEIEIAVATPRAAQ